MIAHGVEWAPARVQIDRRVHGVLRQAEHPAPLEIFLLREHVLVAHRPPALALADNGRAQHLVVAAHVQLGVLAQSERGIEEDRTRVELPVADRVLPIRGRTLTRFPVALALAALALVGRDRIFVVDAFFCRRLGTRTPGRRCAFVGHLSGSFPSPLSSAEISPLSLRDVTCALL
jgi:hypothetical protein